jgi:hypothetical protein
MKKLVVATALVVAVLAGAGCYKTKEGRYRAGMPFSKDTIESRYERPVDQVYQAAKATLEFNGALNSEASVATGDTAARTLTGKVNKRTLWVQVDEVEPRVTRVQVQARKSAGRGDVDLASEIDKQIALRLR